MKHRLDEITDAIEQDTARYNDPPVDSRARVTFEWAKVMEKILKLPVPTWDDPGTVSGEISAAR